ncbi:MAG TPA: hypothetical protein VGC02_00555 [Methanobacterium sp.]
MFGLTNRQFLKKSKKTLQETGAQILSFKGLMNQEAKDQITLLQAQKSLDRLRNEVENTFSRYEKLNPPSKCLQLQQRIMKGLIIFYESLVAYSESLLAKEDGLEEKSQKLLKKSGEELYKYRELSLSLSREVDSNLWKKK